MAAALLLAALAANAIAANNPTPADFTGKWRIAKWIGETQGGVSTTATNAVLGKTVQITNTMIRTPGRTCHLQNPTITSTPNREIETSIWGGQRIVQLLLPKKDIAKAFGPGQTPVFQDKTLCISAIMIDHNHIIDELGSGVIYRLDRIK